MDDRAFPADPEASMSAWERWIFRLLLSVLIGWEAILAGYKLSEFPYHAVDFFQHDFLARFLQQGGRFTDPSWPMQVGSALGLRLPPGLERTAPLLLYQPIVLPFFRALALFPMSIAYAMWLALSLLLIGWTGWRIARALGTPPLPVWFALGLWPAIWHVLLLGNVDLLAWALMNLGLVALLEGRPRRGGFWLGWAVALKGFLIFAAVPWLRREGRPVAEGLAAGLLLSGLWGTLWVGPEGWIFLLQHLPDYGKVLEETFIPGNNSLLAWLWAMVGPPVWNERGIRFHGLLYPQFTLPPRLLYLPLALLLLLLAGIWVRRQRMLPPLIECGYWLSLGLLLWPVSWVNYHIYLFMPLLALALQSDRLRPPTRWMLGLGIALITVALSYGAFMVATPPYMSLPLFLGLTRLFLIGLFLRAASELRANNGSGAST
jgi:hypothetical protein